MMIRLRLDRPILYYVAWIALYVGGLSAGLASTAGPGGVSTVWPANGLALAAFLCLPTPAWPLVVVLISVLSHLMNELFGGTAGNLIWWVSLVDAIGPLTGAILLRYVYSLQTDLPKVSDVVALIVLGGGLGAGIEAFCGAFVFDIGREVQFFDAVLTWWISSGVGVLVVSPFALTILGKGARKLNVSSWRDWVEWICLLAAINLVCHVVFSSPASEQQLFTSMPYAVFPLLFWAAVRFGIPGAGLSSVLVASWAIFRTVTGYGPFALVAGSEASGVLSVQVFLIASTVSSLLIASITSERRRASQLLAEHRESLKTILDSLVDAVVAVDRDGAVLQMNRQAEILAGLTKEEAGGKPLREILPFLSDVVLGEGLRLASSVENQSPIPSLEKKVQNAAGRSVTLMIRSAPITDPRGQPSGSVVVLSDVSTERRLEEQLRLSQRMESIGRLAGGIAHDFNNILTAVLGNAELLLLEMGPDSTYRQPVEDIRLSADRAAVLTRRLLSFSRNRVRKPVAVEVNSEVADAVPLLQRLIGEDVRVVAALCDEKLFCRCEPGQLSQISLNLCLNARDAMSSGGVISLQTERLDSRSAPADLKGAEYPEGLCQLTVSDTGAGMDEETLKYIFEPFFTTKGEGKGTGLGLATVYAAVTQAKGTIEVSSRLGVGTEFKIFLPLVRGVEEPVVVEDLNIESWAGSETVLLVEDEAGVRNTIRKSLELFGYTVLEAAGPDEALKVFEQESDSIDLLITDIVMPGMNGYELAERLSSLKEGLPVLLMSGYAHEEIHRRGISLGLGSALQKPFKQDVLLAKVRKLIRQGTTT